MKSHGERCGQGPGRRRPDDGRDGFPGKTGSMPAGSLLSRYVRRRWAGVHLVLDFRFGECSAVVDAPIDRLQTFVDEILLQEAEEEFRESLASYSLVMVE